MERLIATDRRRGRAARSVLVWLALALAVGLLAAILVRAFDGSRSEIAASMSPLGEAAVIASAEPSAAASPAAIAVSPPPASSPQACVTDTVRTFHGGAWRLP